MGKRYTKKNLGDPNWSKPSNYKIKQNDAIYDVEIVPNKGVKGDISVQPFNDQNAEDIENALVSLDDDLAFIEADYINNAEHALKQDVTDNDLSTTDKTVVGAINEVKSEGEYHDLLQDDAIAIVNNKINALPMNGSLKNIRTSLVGIPTTFTNIDMFNTKQTVTNYQPLSLDYKGAAEPHIILMKTIGDYTFDFAVEATHTNGTDTTIVLEAWVDGVLYDTATRTLVGGSNQINGVTGFFTYSKGTDTVPSEIYFRFRASQGNTSANKTLINTTLFGNSAENSFTDTDHVTGINLNEPTYNGQTTTFIINDLDAKTGQQTSDANGTTFSNGVALTKVQAALPGDISNHLSIYDNTNGIGFSNNAMTYVSQFNTHKFTNPSSVVYAVIKDVIDEPESLITKEYADTTYLGKTAKAEDSDKLDGLDSTQFLRSDVGGEVTGALTLPSVVTLRGSGTGVGNNAYIEFHDNSNSNRTGWIGDGGSGENNITIGTNSGDIVLSPASGYNAKVLGGKIWHEGNDGSGSGLDADLLDGLDSSQFLRTDINSTMYQNLAILGSTVAHTDFQAAYSADNFAFKVTSEGNIYGRCDTGTAGYYVKKETQNNETKFIRASSLLMGDVVINLDDANVYPNVKQTTTTDFGVESRPNAEGEDCLFLIDILENMQNRMNEMQDEINVLKGI